jgi:hypothetical protein
MNDNHNSMRSTLRSFAFGLAGMLALGTMAQYPYTWVIEGQVSGCYPGQTVNIQTVQGTQPSINVDVPVDGNCMFFAVLYTSSAMSFAQLSTTCNGVITNALADATFNFINDTAWSSVTIDCNGGGWTDCNGVLNGPDVPGAVCDDGNPFSWNDIWTVDCICIGTDTIGVVDCLGVPGGPALPGTWCTNFLNDTGFWSVDCICITNSQNYDCNGVLNGPDMPGTACDDGDANTLNDTWSPFCICIGTDTTGGIPDCLGVPGGSALPGTICTTFLNDTGFWSVDCICIPFNQTLDCNGVLNGPDMPGMPCTIPGTTIEGTWSVACVCEENNPAPCEANFWVLQAYTADSNNIEPIPYELWIWNLSSGGSGVYSYLWDFGDGSTSTDPFPTYADNGPYVLCLTIDDGEGCIDTHCDSVSVDEDGFYSGFAGDENRSDGFTINVQNQLTGISEVTTTSDLAIWPNPVVDELNLAVVSDMHGVVNVTVTDLNGRVVLNEQHNLGGGKNQLRISTNELSAGLYTVRIGNDVNAVSQRFVKTR